MKDGYQKNRRILVIDDNESIHDDFQAVLGDADTSTATIDGAEAAIFGAASNVSEQMSFEVDSAFQGQEGLEKIQQALHESRPYQLVFVDMRMPPGWDGIETIEHIWKIDPNIQTVICTAYSDYSWAEITERLGRSENLLILKKPFDNAEVAQLAVALTEKWTLARQASMKVEQLEQGVKERTEELTKVNEQLKQQVAERKRAEEALESLNKDLESSVQKLTRANRELQEFAYIAAHDLKTPLRAIGTLADWLLMDCADKFDEEGKKHVGLLIGRAKQMSALVDDILQYSRVGQNEQNKQELDFNTVLSEVIGAIAPPKGIEITIENELPVIISEKARMTQVFGNLLSNAVKYMDKPSGQIKVGCTEEDGSWRFSVADNGPGIDQRYFEKIFKMFQMLSPRGKTDGNGIGLSIVKKTVELNGGRVWVESEVGKGSTFFFTLPK